jgi:hypothetical protein
MLDGSFPCSPGIAEGWTNGYNAEMGGIMTSDMAVSHDQKLQDPRSRLLWAYEQSLRIEKHWTDQVQDQQNRSAAVLAVNGFLLAFLAVAGLKLSAPPVHEWYFYTFASSLILLSVALSFGVLSLWPMIKIAGSGGSGWLRTTFFHTKSTAFDEEHLWLNSQEITRRALAESQDFNTLLFDLCERAAGNAHGNLDHSNTLIRRRVYMHWQILFIAGALILLIVTLVGWGMHNA